jgi:hypothetical protein
MNQKLLFSFDDLTQKDKAVKALTKAFQRAGATVASLTIDPKLKRTAGITYREIGMVFADSQLVTLRIKPPGDIYQVVVNKQVIPIANQDDHLKAVGEIVRVMERGRTAFQKKLTRAKVALPSGLKTAAPKIEAQLTARRDELKGLVVEARAELEALQAA